MRILFRRHDRASGGYIPKQSSDADSSRIERLFIPSMDFRRPRWPSHVGALRRYLPDNLVSSPPSRISEKGNWFVVMFAGEQAVGYAWTIRSLVNGEAYVEEVVVSPDWRGRGIGGSLLIETARWLSESRFDTMTLMAITSPGWIMRLGFTSTGNRNFRIAIEQLLTAAS